MQPVLLSGVEVLVVEPEESVCHTGLQWPWSEPKLALHKELCLTITCIVCCEDDPGCVLYVPPGVDHELLTSWLDVIEGHLSVGESRGTKPVLDPVVCSYHSYVFIVKVCPQVKVFKLFVVVLK